MLGAKIYGQVTANVRFHVLETCVLLQLWQDMDNQVLLNSPFFRLTTGCLSS